jgi:hypothetical protein
MNTQAVTAYACEYLWRWCADAPGATDLFAALALLASGRGPARVPTCEHTLRHARFLEPGDVLGDSRPLLLRALSLFGPGELRAVRVINPTCLDLITECMYGLDTVEAVRLAEPLSSLRAVAWESGFGMSMEPAFDFIERHAADLTELDCNFWERHGAADRALACCTRLESLTNAQYYDAKVWLGLTHLHTLRDVDLGVVSAAAIAAALPRLHTLSAFISAHDDQPVPHVAGFFEDLVPRLRVLHYSGPWPEDNQAFAVIMPQPLPLLQELVFSFPRDSAVARRFAGAQPVILHVPHAAAALMASEMTHRPLARVRNLCLAFGGSAPDSSDVARLLHAAPQLRKFSCRRRLQGGLKWLHHPAFTGLVHPWLRSVRVDLAVNAEPAPVECGVQLRRLHFPRLQQLIVNSVQRLVHDE